MTLISKLELERMKYDAYKRGKQDGAAEERERFREASIAVRDAWRAYRDGHGTGHEVEQAIGKLRTLVENAICNQEDE